MKNILQLIRELGSRDVRFVAIGVWGANFYARTPAGVLQTQDTDFFLPSEPRNLLKAWDACDAVGLSLWAGDEPLDSPRDLVLAGAICLRRALTRATDESDLLVDFTLVMAGFEFEQVWKERRSFRAEGIVVPVARLTHIVQSKAAAGRPKDRLFLGTLAEELGHLDEIDRPPPTADQGRD
jgi:hypothetical protein